MLEPYVGFKIAIRSKWRRSSVKYVLKMKMKWALKLLQDINMMKNEEIKRKFKMSQLEEIICLKLAMKKWSASSRWAISKRSFAWILLSIWWSWICEDAPKKKLSHDGLWGSNPQDFVKQAQARKAFHLVAVKIVIIELKWNAQG